jgi:SAM-dependent methyltransferase
MGEQVDDSKLAGRPSAFKNVFLRLKNSLGGGPSFSNSADYWEDRYRSGGDSGAGSYNRLAAFKAEVLNDFVARNSIRSVIEFGVGDGAQLRLANYLSYIGVDVSETVVKATRARFAADQSVKIVHTSEVDDQYRADLALSLDVIYHLVEDETFDGYMRQLFAAATKYVAVYASNFDSDWPNPHVRHRKFTRWVETNKTDFELVETIENRYPYSEKDVRNTSFANFYIFSKLDTEI